MDITYKLVASLRDPSVTDCSEKEQTLYKLLNHPPARNSSSEVIRSHSSRTDCNQAMEFPNLGHHCSEPTCKQLDFLPVKCDGCSNLFCLDHMSYNSHACSGAYKKDIQVPVCPLCNTPIPIKRGDPPDIAVGRHIDSNCDSDTARSRRKVYANRCSSKSCKAKELMPITCGQCHLNYCLRHRHPSDHQCTGSNTKSLNAALARQSKGDKKDKTGPFIRTSALSPLTNQSSRAGRSNNFSTIQGSLDEDEAMARALAASMQDSHPSPARVSTDDQRAQEDEDLQLARAIERSQREIHARRSTSTSNSVGKCQVS